MFQSEQWLGLPSVLKVRRLNKAIQELSIIFDELISSLRCLHGMLRRRLLKRNNQVSYCLYYQALQQTNTLQLTPSPPSLSCSTPILHPTSITLCRVSPRSGNGLWVMLSSLSVSLSLPPRLYRGRMKTLGGLMSGLIVSCSVYKQILAQIELAHCSAPPPPHPHHPVVLQGSNCDFRMNHFNKQFKSLDMRYGLRQ